MKESSKNGETISSPPPTKKLKQARLPFTTLPNKGVVVNSPVNKETNNKKRKLSEDDVVPPKPPKTPKGEEHAKKITKVGVANAENKVSSSSEAEIKSKKNDNDKSKSVGLLDKFVRTAQQPEVSTSCEENIVDLTENECEPPAEPDTPVSCNGKELEDSVSTKINTSSKTKDAKEISTPSTKQALSPAPSSSVKTVTPGSNRKPGLVKDGRDRQKKEKEEKKQREKEEKEKKRIKEKEEKERLKREEKEEKERLKREEKEKKEKEKEEKKRKFEDEKKKKEEEKEREKQEKLLQREEEKKKKDEQKKQEQEEKEREKQKAEAEKKNVTVKQQKHFQNFFTKKEKEEPKEKNDDQGNSIFIPFQANSDTRLAPVCRVDSSKLVNKVLAVDEYLESQDCSELYIGGLKQRKIKINGSEMKTFPYINEDSCCMIVSDDKPKKEEMRAKLLQFHENNRPAYYGTWTKTSKLVGPRTPLGKEESIMDYEVDSDDEWEEEEPGESLSDPEDEEEEAVVEDEEDDGFFVPHGYLSEGEGGEDEDDEDVTPDRLKARQLAKAKEFEASLNRKTEILKPVCVGPVWYEPDQKLDFMAQMLEQFKMVILTRDTPIPVVPRKKEEPLTKANKKDKRKAAGQQVPEEAIPDLIRMLHGNPIGVQTLLGEFREYWRAKEAGKDPVEAAKEFQESKAAAAIAATTETTDSQGDSQQEGTADGTANTNNGGSGSNTPNTEKEDKVYSISKRQLEKTIRSMAVYEKRNACERKCWFVNDAMLEKHNLKDMPIPCEWQWITRAAPKVREPRSEVSTPTPGSTSGRQTPTQATPKQITNTITKFTKPGIAPQVYTPTPVTPKPVITATTPKANTITKFTKPGIAPKVYSPTPVTPKSGADTAAAGAAPKVNIAAMLSAQKAGTPKRLPKNALNALKRLPVADNSALPSNINLEEGKDDDCAITDVELPKRDKSQPSVLSLFKPKANGNTSNTRAKKAVQKPKGPQKKKQLKKIVGDAVKKAKSGKDSEKSKTESPKLGSEEAPMEID